MGSPSLTLLIVDDNIDYRLALARFLSEQFTVVMAADGNTALDLLQRQAINVVLLDVGLRGMSGFEVVQAMRKDAALQTIPVVLMSAEYGRSQLVQAQEAGAQEYLMKPVDLSFLEQRLTHWASMRATSASEQVTPSARPTSRS